MGKECRQKPGRNLSSFDRETLGGAEDDLAQPAELAGADVASAIPRCHRDELDVENVAGFEARSLRVVDQAGGLRFAVGVEMEPLVFLGTERDRLLKPVPVRYPPLK